MDRPRLRDLDGSAVSVPIYETSSAEQIEWIVGDSGAKAVFAETAEHEARVAEVRDRLPGLAHVWGIDAGGVAEVTALGADTGDDVVEQRRRSRTAADLATLVYTSGTTGRPKGCEITHGNLVSTARNAVQGAISEVAVEGSSTLLFLPLAHVFARLIEVATIEGGIVLGHSDIPNLLPDLASFQPTFLLAVPRVFEKVYNGAEQKAAADGKGKVFKAAAETAVAYSRALDAGRPGLGLRAKHKVFDILVYGSCAPPSAARSSTPCRAARRWASASGTSSAASASRSWRATGSPRRPRPPASTAPPPSRSARW